MILRSLVDRKGSKRFFQGELKVKAKATMLLKINVGERPDLIKATMSMKTRHL
jgi:hypothetical protein